MTRRWIFRGRPVRVDNVQTVRLTGRRGLRNGKGLQMVSFYYEDGTGASMSWDRFKREATPVIPEVAS